MARFAAANPLSDDNAILKQALTRLIQLLDTGYVVESTLNGITYRISITAKEGIVITADGTEVMWIDTATGNIRFSGDITGSSGTFSGTISGGSIYIPNSTSPVFSVNSSGTMNASSGTFSGSVSGATINGGTINGTAIYIPNSTSPVFSVNSSGTMNASSGTFGGSISGGSISIPATDPKFSVASTGKTTIKNVADIYNGIIIATSASMPSYSVGGGINTILCGSFGTLPNTEYDNDLGLWINGQAFFDDDVLTDGSFIADNDVLPRIADKSWCGTEARNFTQVWGRQLHAKDDVYGDSFIPSSDARLKTEIQPVQNGVDLILNLDPVQYKMIAGNSGRIHYGFLAQQLKEAMTQAGIPDAGVYVDRSLDINPETGLPYNPYLAIRYDELISPVVQTIQYQQKRINDLESRLANLEARLAPSV